MNLKDAITKKSLKKFVKERENEPPADKARQGGKALESYTASESREMKEYSINNSVFCPYCQGDCRYTQSFQADGSVLGIGQDIPQNLWGNGRYEAEGARQQKLLTK